ncbi:MAG: electron transport complex subunit E [Chromatiales bacterium]|jgi:electron transport complex protein RnfE|nr:electron transport complex subunit E [Chromatiales bacterium]
MSQVSYTALTREGLWTNNPALVQVLGLCPLMAVTNTAVSGLGLGLATATVIMLTNGIISAIRSHTRPEIRVPAFMMVIACVVTGIELAMNAWLHELYQVLGIFIALISTNCTVLARGEAFASKNKVLPSMYDGFIMGMGLTLVLITLGSMRELLGTGTLFANANLLFGEAGRALTIKVIDDYRGFLVAILPPGGFLGLGLLIALKNVINTRRQRKAQAVKTPSPAAVPELTPA